MKKSTATVAQNIKKASAQNEEREIKFREDEQDIIDDQAILQTVLMGGDKSKIDSLYNAYWALLGQLQNSLKDEKSAKKVLQSTIISNFLKVLSSPTPNVSVDPPNTSVAFKNLSPEIQNLLLAATELNIKLSGFEQVLTDKLSSSYSQASKVSSDCIILQIEQLKKYEGDVVKRTKNLHLQSVQNMMGARYGIFMNKAIQGLQAWSILSSQMGLQGLRQNDWSSIENIFDALKEAKRNLMTAKMTNVKASDLITDANAPIAQDPRFLMRMQKHQLTLERAEKANSLRNEPEELAKVLRILRVADDELNDALNKDHVHKDLGHEKNREDGREDNTLSSLQEVITNLVDHGHVLAVESEHIRKSLEDQVRKELNQEIQTISEHSLKCIDETKINLKKISLAAVERYQDEVKQTRDAERTIANELQLYRKSSKIAALSIEVCAKAISEASKNRKLARDVKTLNDHKLLLRDILQKISETLRTL
jgi:hypothetical protein